MKQETRSILKGTFEVMQLAYEKCGKEDPSKEEIFNTILGMYVEETERHINYNVDSLESFGFAFVPKGTYKVNKQAIKERLEFNEHTQDNLYKVLDHDNEIVYLALRNYLEKYADQMYQE